MSPCSLLPTACWNVVEVYDKRSGAFGYDPSRSGDGIRAITTVEGAVILGKPRLMHVDGIYCEVQLSGPLVLVKNLDVPGVVGHIGTILASNNINIANFSLGRRDSGEPLEAMAAVTTDTLVPQKVLDTLMSNPAIKLARFVPAI